MDADGSGALSPDKRKVMLYKAGYNASDKMMQVIMYNLKNEDIDIHLDRSFLDILGNTL